MLINKKFGNIEISVETKGAELKSLIKDGKEFMWEANPKFWGKTSPVLFPFVGASKGDKYTYDGKEYPMGRHGFVRESEFDLFEDGENNLKFICKSDENSLKIYPFNFEFFINYVITNDGVNLEYTVMNKEEGEIYFSLGAHPAFAAGEFPVTDYYLEFSSEETLDLYTLDGSFVKRDSVSYLNNSKVIKVTEDLFKNDALIFKDMKSEYLTLKNIHNSVEVKVSLKEFPWLGIWSPPGAPFVCIEPWCGLADFVDHNGELTKKDAVNRLGKNGMFNRTMEIIVKN